MYKWFRKTFPCKSCLIYILGHHGRKKKYFCLLCLARFFSLGSLTIALHVQTIQLIVNIFLLLCGILCYWSQICHRNIAVLGEASATYFFFLGWKKTCGGNVRPCTGKSTFQAPVHNLKLRRGSNRETISAVTSILVILITTFQDDMYRSSVWKSPHAMRFESLHLCSSGRSEIGMGWGLELFVHGCVECKHKASIYTKLNYAVVPNASEWTRKDSWEDAGSFCYDIFW